MQPILCVQTSIRARNNAGTKLTTGREEHTHTHTGDVQLTFVWQVPPPRLYIKTPVREQSGRSPISNWRSADFLSRGSLDRVSVALRRTPFPPPPQTHTHTIRVALISAYLGRAFLLAIPTLSARFEYRIQRRTFIIGSRARHERDPPRQIEPKTVSRLQQMVSSSPAALLRTRPTPIYVAFVVACSRLGRACPRRCCEGSTRTHLAFIYAWTLGCPWTEGAPLYRQPGVPLRHAWRRG